MKDVGLAKPLVSPWYSFFLLVVRGHRIDVDQVFLELRSALCIESVKVKIIVLRSSFFFAF